MKRSWLSVYIGAACLAIGLLLSAWGGGNLFAQGQAAEPGQGRASALSPGRAAALDQGLEETAYFRFDIPPDPETFVIRLSDPQKINRARAMLAGIEPDLHLLGQIVKQPAGYNPPWGFHLEPDSIEFFHSAIEVCDASILSVAQHLEEVCGAFLPGCTWCPWGSRLVEEVGGGGQAVYLPVVVR